MGPGCDLRRLKNGKPHSVTVCLCPSVPGGGALDPVHGRFGRARGRGGVRFEAHLRKIFEILDANS